MKFRLPLVMVLAALIFTIFAAPASAQIADGTYQVNYEMKEKSSDNTSIADGYFQSPATLTVENGVQTITLTVTGSNYIQSLTAPSGPVTIVSEDEANHTRTVSFRVDGDLSKPISLDMHIIVPDLYDQTHTARMVISNAGNLPTAGSESDTGTETAGSETDEAAGGNGEAVENPKTGENSSMALYAGLMLASVIGLIAIRKLRPARD